MASAISVPYEIWADQGITEANPPEGPHAKVIYTCSFENHYQLIRDLMWNATRSGSTIIRTFGYSYPLSPNLTCSSIEAIDFYGKPFLVPWLGAPWLTRKQARVTAVFTVPKFGADASTDASGQPFTTTTLGIGAEFLTIPKSSYIFDTSSTPTNTDIGRLIPQVEINYKRHWMPYLPVYEMLTLAGHVNDAPFLIGIAGKVFSCATGTLLFLGGDNEIQSDTSGAIIQEVTYKFMYRPVAWNAYLHPSRGVGFDLVSDGSGNRPYPSGTFSILP